MNCVRIVLIWLALIISHSYTYCQTNGDVDQHSDAQADIKLKRHENIDAHLDSAFIKPEVIKFLEDGQFTLNWRTHSLDRSTEGEADKEAVVTGGTLGWKSGYLYDVLQVGYTHGMSQKVYAPSDKDGTGLLQSGQHSYQATMEAYLDVKLGQTFITLGRLYLNTPYINKHDNRETPNSFQGARIQSHPTERLSLMAAYITDMKEKTSQGYDDIYYMAGIDGKDDGVTVLGCKWDYTQNNSIGGFSFLADDYANTYYSEAKNKIYTFASGDTLNFDLQYTHQKSAGDKLAGDIKSEHFGAKLTWNRPAISPYIVYTYYSDDDQIESPWGGIPGYTSIIVQDFDRPGEETIMGGVTIEGKDFGYDRWSSFINLAYGDTPDNGTNASPDQYELDITIDYRIADGLFKGLWFRARYAHIEQWNSDNKNDSKDMDDFRLIVNYDYHF